MQNDISRAEMEVIAGVLSAGGLGLNLLIELCEPKSAKDIEDFLMRGVI